MTPSPLTWKFSGSPPRGEGLLVNSVMQGHLCTRSSVYEAGFSYSHSRKNQLIRHLSFYPQALCVPKSVALPAFVLLSLKSLLLSVPGGDIRKRLINKSLFNLLIPSCRDMCSYFQSMIVFIAVSLGNGFASCLYISLCVSPNFILSYIDSFKLREFQPLINFTRV